MRAATNLRALTSSSYKHPDGHCTFWDTNLTLSYVLAVPMAGDKVQAYGSPYSGPVDVALLKPVTSGGTFVGYPDVSLIVRKK